MKGCILKVYPFQHILNFVSHFFPSLALDNSVVCLLSPRTFLLSIHSN